jgi:hypothetical protein
MLATVTLAHACLVRVQLQGKLAIRSAHIDVAGALVQPELGEMGAPQVGCGPAAQDEQRR